MKNDSVMEYYNVLKKRRFALVCKRLFDIFLSLFLLVFLIPIILVVSLLIILESNGSVFFTQTRVTQYGKKFKIFKFRTMVNDAEKIGAQVTSENDSRITKIGKYLRKLRIDEIPQIFNILKGDMSFVGVRPEVPKYVESYTPEMYATLLLPAGVTSLTSILYKDESELIKSSNNPDEVYVSKILPQKMKYNLQYIKSFSLADDLKIMIKTVFAVLKK